MRKRTKWLCSVLLVATIGLTGCGQKQKTESRAEKSDENHFVGEWIVEPEYAISKVGDENTLFVDGRGEKKGNPWNCKRCNCYSMAGLEYYRRKAGR